MPWPPLPALEVPAVERRAAGAVHPEVRRDDPFLERGGRHRDLEGRPGRVAALQRAVLQRLELVRDERGPGRAVDAGRERVRIVGRLADEREHFAVARIEHDGGAVVAEVLEAFFRGPLHVGVDRQLQPLPFLGIVLSALTSSISRPRLLTIDGLVAIGPHQPPVVGLLDAGLPDDRPRLDALVVGRVSCASVTSPT